MGSKGLGSLQFLEVQGFSGRLGFLGVLGFEVDFVGGARLKLKALVVPFFVWLLLGFGPLWGLA